MRAYSEDLRQQVVQACDEGVLTRHEIAEHFAVSSAWIRRLLQRRRDTGSFSALPGGRGPNPKLNEVKLQRLAKQFEECPDATLAELKKRARLSCGLSTIHNALKKLGLNVKKSLRAREQDRDDVRQGRKSWPHRLGRRNKRRLFYLDESGAQTNLIRR